jgi:hypothetical protein
MSDVCSSLAMSRYSTLQNNPDALSNAQHERNLARS